MTWQFLALGTAVLKGEGAKAAGKSFHPERRTAALLTFLALEGPSTRAKLAGLLWPESGESGARTNLRQLLSRLKKTTGSELVIGGDMMSLQHLELDAANFKVLAFSNSDEALRHTGELLAPYDYDDCPDFADWLLGERERLKALKQNLLEQKVLTLEQTAHYAEALSYAEQLLLLEPLSEDAHRQVMRLHYLCGDRAAALAAFERCKSVLDKELGVEPLEATLKLVSEIEFGAVLPTALPTKQKTELPLRVLRPPMIGREAAWQLMEKAWEHHQLIFVSGVAGVGKSRLIQEFLASKESKCGWFAGRLSDIHVPYATLTRSFRQVLAEFPVTLEPWVQRELSRVLPELGDAPAAMNSESDLLRFYEAQNAVLQLAQTNGMQAIVYEDAHHIDAASLEAFLHLGENHWAKHDGLRMIVSFRPDEIRPDEAFAAKTISDLVSLGLAVRIELESLTEPEVNQLVGGLGIADLEKLATQLSRYTGGNPFLSSRPSSTLLKKINLLQTPLRFRLRAKCLRLLKSGCYDSLRTRSIWSGRQLSCKITFR
jgi:DNA-binding SARP family transcriptional activator